MSLCLKGATLKQIRLKSQIIHSELFLDTTIGHSINWVVFEGNIVMLIQLN